MATKRTREQYLRKQIADNWEPLIDAAIAQAKDGSHAHLRMLLEYEANAKTLELEQTAEKPRGHWLAGIVHDAIKQGVMTPEAGLKMLEPFSAAPTPQELGVIKRLNASTALAPHAESQRQQAQEPRRAASRAGKASNTPESRKTLSAARLAELFANLEELNALSSVE